MTVRELKDVIENLPDSLLIYSRDDQDEIVVAEVFVMRHGVLVTKMNDKNK